MKKELSNEELNNVKGGLGGGEKIKTTCPSCKVASDNSDIIVRKESSGCTTIVYYKCPKCGHEWSQEL